MKKIILFLSIFLISTNLFGIILPDGTDATVTNIKQEENRILYVCLKEPTKINTPIGKVVAKDYVYYNSNGRVTKFTPNEEGIASTPIGNLPYQAKEITFYTSGNIKTFYLNTTLSLTTPYGKIQVDSDYIQFYDNWIPEFFNVSENTDFKILDGTFSILKGTTLFFYENGAIKRFTYDAATEINTPIGKITPDKNQTVKFHSNGKLSSIFPSEISLVTVESNTFYIDAQKEIRFTDKGNIAGFSTSSVSEISIGTIKIKHTGSSSAAFLIFPNIDGSYVVTSQDELLANIKTDSYHNYGNVVYISANKKLVAYLQEYNLYVFRLINNTAKFTQYFNVYGEFPEYNDYDFYINQMFSFDRDMKILKYCNYRILTDDTNGNKERIYEFIDFQN